MTKLWAFCVSSANLAYAWLERSLALSRETGKPEQSFSIVHVAGTNGKGSVAAMIESVLRASGFRVGLYTSPPHLASYTERIMVGGVKSEKRH